MKRLRLLAECRNSGRAAKGKAHVVLVQNRGLQTKRLLEDRREPDDILSEDAGVCQQLRARGSARGVPGVRAGRGDAPAVVEDSPMRRVRSQGEAFPRPGEDETLAPPGAVRTDRDPDSRGPADSVLQVRSPHDGGPLGPGRIRLHPRIRGRGRLVRSEDRPDGHGSVLRHQLGHRRLDRAASREREARRLASGRSTTDGRASV